MYLSYVSFYSFVSFATFTAFSSFLSFATIASFPTFSSSVLFAIIASFCNYCIIFFIVCKYLPYFYFIFSFVSFAISEPIICFIFFICIVDNIQVGYLTFFVCVICIIFNNCIIFVPYASFFSIQLLPGFAQI